MQISRAEMRAETGGGCADRIISQHPAMAMAIGKLVSTALLKLIITDVDGGNENGEERLDVVRFNDRVEERGSRSSPGVQHVHNLTTKVASSIHDRTTSTSVHGHHIRAPNCLFPR